MIKKNRMIVVGCIFVIVFSFLLGRLAQIQLLETEKFGAHKINLLEKSVEMRTRSIVLDDGRGMFVDRFQNSLTEETHYYMMLFPFLNNTSWPVEDIASILNVKSEDILRELAKEEEPFAFPKKKPLELTPIQVKKIQEKNVNGVIVAEKKVSRKVPLAEHVVGIVRENNDEINKLNENRKENSKYQNTTKVGVSGLQKSFNDLLMSDTNSKLLYHVDGKGEPLFGESVKYYDNGNPFFPVTVETTINYRMQELMERALNNHRIKKGAAILIDIKSNEILGMVSRPKINQEDPYKENSIINRAVQANTPGSVFKTVVAAAALETQPNTFNQTFNCNLNVYGVEEKPEKQKGMLSFTDSFAQSCNNTFAILASDLLKKDKNILNTTMKQLGIDEYVGWNDSFFQYDSFKQLQDEESNTVWGKTKEKYVGDKTLRQIGIGQLNVKLTPMAIANMMATIARGGQAYEVKLVNEVFYKDGTSLYKFPSKKMGTNPVSEKTIEALQHMLEQVVADEKGTGFLLRGLPYQVAGKSGTAELSDGDDVLHNKWFAGFFPFEFPKYALVVLEQKTSSDNGAYALAFGDIVKGLYNLDRSIETK